MIWEALPIEASANTWGDEIYFGIPVAAGDEAGQEVVDLGDPGVLAARQRILHLLRAYPHEQERRNPPRQPVTVVGKISGDPTVFKQVASGAPVLIERA